MVRNPQPGRTYRLNYRDKAMPYQGWPVAVLAVGRGPGPRNVLVCPRPGERVVVARGNLIEQREKETTHASPGA